MVAEEQDEVLHNTCSAHAVHRTPDRLDPCLTRLLLVNWQQEGSGCNVIQSAPAVVNGSRCRTVLPLQQLQPPVHVEAIHPVVINRNRVCGKIADWHRSGNTAYM